METQSNNSNKVSKYKSDELIADSDEYKFVKRFFDRTKHNLLVSISKLVKPPSDFKMYKIVENNPTKTLAQKRRNLMLFHGTNEKGVEGILREGFMKRDTLEKVCT